MTSHTAALQAKHASIETQIASEERRPRPDEALVHLLKKQKLKLKELLAGL